MGASRGAGRICSLGGFPTRTQPSSSPPWTLAWFALPHFGFPMWPPETLLRAAEETWSPGRRPRNPSKHHQKLWAFFFLFPHV